MKQPDNDLTPDLSLEQDDRFPSGPWTGFFLQREIKGKSWMELVLTFKNGGVEGTGRDWVGPFLIKGKYSVEDGKCFWHKSYIGKHTLVYNGYNEGRGIWGMWEWDRLGKGGFHIWPEALRDPTEQRLVEKADVPIPLELVESETLSQPI